MWLILQDGTWGFPIQLDAHTCETLRRQLDRAEACGSLLPLAHQLSVQFADALQRTVSPEFRLPTNRQLAEAAAVARMLGLPIPADALKCRSSMRKFLQQDVQVDEASKG
jgi:hypothetical protein